MVDGVAGCYHLRKGAAVLDTTALDGGEHPRVRRLPLGDHTGTR
jgi:hypothetical protein